MEKLVAELSEVMDFKDTTDIGDIVLVVAKEPKMLLYAQVTTIERDRTKKDEWWHVGLNMLAIPPQKTTWTLRTSQMTGMEIFTMGGEQRFFKAVDFGIEEVPSTPSPKDKVTRGGLKRIK
ncbi:MAG: hypothetical protein ABFS19_00395 [Thermodesulfobacteriota bacterium]